jgi:hypothetical protein
MDAFLVRVPKLDGDAVLKSADAARKIIAATAGTPPLDLGEYWIALHFLLSGETPIPRHEALRRGLSWDDDSPENILMGGAPTPFMSSFGPARYLHPEQVERLATKLAGLSVAEFQARYNPEDLRAEDISPGGWDDGGEALARLSRYFEELVAFYTKAAAHGEGMLIYMV